MPTPPPTLPSDYALQNFRHAVGVALQREGHLLTAGEMVVVRRWLALPPEAASLYARLQQRSRDTFRVHQLNYADVTSPAVAVQHLDSTGLVDTRKSLPTALLLALRTVAELRDLCRRHQVPTSGVRQVLLDRMAPIVTRSELPGQVIRIRHKDLFRRLCRWFLLDHSGDLSRMVVADLGHVRYPRYTPTSGAGLYANRRDLICYETMLRLVSSERTEAQWAEVAESALSLTEGLSPATAGRRRLSARRMGIRATQRAVRAVERAHSAHAAVPLYVRLLALEDQAPSSTAHRLSLCLDRTGEAEAGARVCHQARGGSLGQPMALSLERTGKRLARKAAIQWEALPRCQTPPIHSVHLTQVEDSPPRFEGSDEPKPVEQAVMDLLHRSARTAVFSENALWTSLFGLLFRDVLFADVPGMLPGRHLHGPLDLGQAGFYERRRQLVDARLADITNGCAHSILRRTVEQHSGEAIVGVAWSFSVEDVLAPVCEAFGGTAIAGLLRHFIDDYDTAKSGLPDLCILPGSSTVLPGDLSIPKGALLVEIKGPTDALRDNQRWWHYQLTSLGIPTEIWRVTDAMRQEFRRR